MYESPVYILHIAMQRRMHVYVISRISVYLCEFIRKIFKYFAYNSSNQCIRLNKRGYNFIKPTGARINLH